MGGRVIEVNLEGTETLNPWDLPLGETIPGKEKIAFLKNLTRHMIGDSPHSDTSLLDNLLSDAISRTYKRCAIRSEEHTSELQSPHHLLCHLLLQKKKHFLYPT